MSDQANNPYLHGNFAPLRQESDCAAEIVGAAPPELRGRLLRIGPNPQFAPLAPYHWFTGDGMVHYSQASIRLRTILLQRVTMEAWRTPVSCSMPDDSWR